ncbi:MAG: hypothetical protein ACK47B_00805 [Armatimonadota bacterium]
MLKRSAVLWMLLASLATLPVFARDFRSWRTDGIHLRGSSVGQQSTHQAFNLYESLLDTGALDLSLYWKGALQEHGGMTTAPFGDVPPTQALRDNREQDAEVDWSTWGPVASKAPAPPRPLFTPNVPQAWSPMVLDLDQTNGGNPDHVLVSVSFEPLQPGGSTREQVLNLYYPQVAAGLPQNATSVTAADRGTVRPLWVRGGNTSTPGMLIRNLAPVRASLTNAADPGVGVVTHAPILARVPATFAAAQNPTDPNRQPEILPVVYLVVGTGENNDFARVICVSLKRPDAFANAAANPILPNPASYTTGTTLEAPNGDYFNPTNGDGNVMWSYTVRARDGVAATPVAGISFADVGDSTLPVPLVFLTTADGQVIALNGRAVDQRDVSQDGDPAIDVQNPTPRWTWATPSRNVGGVPELPGFSYGMAPAVARVPLDEMFSGQGNSSQTVTNAAAKHNVTEWPLYVADKQGTFWALEAPGRTDRNGSGAVTGHSALVRWKNEAAADAARLDALGQRERFILPPVIYQGNTPMLTSGGAVVNGSSDVGFDDQVIFGAEKGNVFALDAIGELMVEGAANADDGRPTGNTSFRWQWPQDDTTLTNADDFTNTAEEPRVWPRELRDPNLSTSPTPARLAPPVDPADYFTRSPLAVALGGNSNPDGSNPNLDPGDDAVFVPYLQERAADPSVPAGNRGFWEYVGSLKPYGFVQVSRPVLELREIEFTQGADTFKLPLNTLRVGTVKGNGLPSNLVQTTRDLNNNPGGANPNYDPVGLTPEDTIYFADTTWYADETGEYVTLPFGTQVTIRYRAPASPSDLTPQDVTETLVFPSCYRDISTDPAVITPARSRASLSEAYNRLEQRRITRSGATFTVEHENPALVPTGDFLIAPDGEGARPPAMFGAGSSSTAGTLLVPSLFRGRVVAFDHRLRLQRIIPGFYHPALQTGALPQEPPAFGPATGDPGSFVQTALGTPFVEDIPASRVATQPGCPDIGGSVTVVDGWIYLTYRNGHTRSLANVSGGGAGAGGGTGANPPLWEGLPGPPSGGGNLVRAPLSIRILRNKPPTDISTFNPGANDYRDSAELDASVLLEWGETLYAEVYYGPANELPPLGAPPASPHAVPQPGSLYLDPQVLQREVQGQIRSKGAVQQLPGSNRGTRPTVANGRVIAIVPIFAGVPSGTNPLTPGTPLLWEKTSPEFKSELTYEYQVTQPGLQWRWPGPDTDNDGQYDPDPKKVHFWEVEPAQNGNPYPTTAGPGNWAWADSPATTDVVENEYAPLVSYNNPIALYYDPDLNPASNVFGMWDGGTGRNAVGTEVTYTDRLARGRRNGDLYETPYVDGSRSGSGRPVVPTVGVAVAGGEARQVLFGEHGKSTPLDSTVYPGASKLGVADRSHLALAGRSLQIRVQPAPLTKLGAGAHFGTLNNAALRDTNPNRPKGSFDQNLNYWDDGAHGMYSSLPESQLVVSKVGTALNLTSAPVQVSGRNPDGSLPNFNQFEQLAVQVDIPRFAADDVYGTRWRFTGQNGVNPTDPRANFNPYYPSTVAGPNGQAGRSYWDRAEQFSKGPVPTNNTSGPLPAANEDRSSTYVPSAAYDPAGAQTPQQIVSQTDYYDDRMKRVVLFNDANNNGQLDLSPNFREAYRTFAVQVVVKPELRVEAQQQGVDLGAVWHGKKGPGMTPDTLPNLWEWQRMESWRLAGNPSEQALGTFYKQYWRPFNLVNTGNVNMPFIKPELVFQLPNQPAKYIALAGEGNDPWRALPLVNPLATNDLRDPFQIFLRTSLDDMMTDGDPYGFNPRSGAWLQKAPVGAANPGSVVYVHDAFPNQPNLNPEARDPSNGGRPRDTWLALNLPLGTPLGTYSGSVRFYNDRVVSFQESPNQGVGFQYLGADTRNGILNRDTTGSTLEAATDPPVRLKVKVIENVAQGRQRPAATAQDQDRRVAPTGVIDFDQNGALRGLLVGYATNFLGLYTPAGAPLPQREPNRFDLFATRVLFDSQRRLFEFDELPIDTVPWRNPFNNAVGFGVVSGTPPASSLPQASKPTMLPGLSGGGLVAWVQRISRGSGNDEYRIYYTHTLQQTTPLELTPRGTPLDPRVPRQGVQLTQSYDANGNPYWMAFYAVGPGTRQNLVMSFSLDPSQADSWSAEAPVATSKSLSTVRDPFASITDQAVRRPAPLPQTDPNMPPFLATELGLLPQMAWISYAGTSQSRGLTDVYMTRYRTAALAQEGQRNAANQQSGAYDYARVGYPRVAADVSVGGQVYSVGGEVLQANTTRTTYSSSWVDWLSHAHTPVQVYLGRGDLPAGSLGSRLQPLPLIDVNAQGQAGTGGEVEFRFSNQLQAAVPRLQNERILIDRAAGIVRFSRDTRTLSLLLGQAGVTPPFQTNSPDPVVSADFTPATLRITRGDVSASDPVIVPVLTQRENEPIMDASWYRQTIDTQVNGAGQTKAQAGIPVPGRADRIWVFWRRATGAVSGGTSAFYKILRPGVRVSNGSILGVQPSELIVSVNGTTLFPEEVNPQNGQIYLPHSFEGQEVEVRYRLANGTTVIERHRVSWLDESGERPVPMETSINEGSLHAFATFEAQLMSPLGQPHTALAPVAKLDRAWVFWSSTRFGGDIVYATLAPRIGMETNIAGSAVLNSITPSALSRLSANAARQQELAVAEHERRQPFTVPVPHTPGPLPHPSTPLGKRAAAAASQAGRR